MGLDRIRGRGRRAIHVLIIRRPCNACCDPATRVAHVATHGTSCVVNPHHQMCQPPNEAKLVSLLRALGTAGEHGQQPAPPHFTRTKRHTLLSLQADLPNMATQADHRKGTTAVTADATTAGVHAPAAVETSSPESFVAESFVTAEVSDFGSLNLMQQLQKVAAANVSVLTTLARTRTPTRTSANPNVMQQL